ncbi:hypothetical protein BH23PLA1_BH23PLA1_04090 [soil metagenome]
MMPASGPSGGRIGMGSKSRRRFQPQGPETLEDRLVLSSGWASPQGRLSELIARRQLMIEQHRARPAALPPAFATPSRVAPVRAVDVIHREYSAFLLDTAQAIASYSAAIEREGIEAPNQNAAALLSGFFVSGTRRLSNQLHRSLAPLQARSPASVRTDFALRTFLEQSIAGQSTFLPVTTSVQAAGTTFHSLADALLGLPIALATGPALDLYVRQVFDAIEASRLATIDGISAFARGYDLFNPLDSEMARAGRDPRASALGLV